MDAGAPTLLVGEGFVAIFAGCLSCLSSVTGSDAALSDAGMGASNAGMVVVVVSLVSTTSSWPLPTASSVTAVLPSGASSAAGSTSTIGDNKTAC